MNGLAYVRENLAGAWAVMTGRPAGLARLDTSIEGFWRSFAVIVLIAPFIVLALMSERRLVAATATEGTEPAGGSYVLDAISVLVDWVAFPLLFALLARPLALSSRYVPFIVARNWSSVVISAFVSVAHAAHLLGVLPSEFAPIFTLILIAIALRFSYVIARVALGVGVAMAIAIVAFDLLLSMTIWSAFSRLG
jgi:hypothetical protein